MIIAVFIFLNRLIMRKSITTVLLIFLFVLCGYSQNNTSKEEAKLQDIAIFNTFKKNLEAGHFYFEADWATANDGRRINLISNSNFLKLIQLQASAHLPFHGVVHSPSFGTGGINFDNQIQEYELVFSDEKKKATIKFNVKNKTELFMIQLTIFQNQSATVSISSNYRSTMNYQGELKPIEQKNQ